MVATIFTSCSKDDETIAVTEITLDKTTLTLALSEDTTLTATVSPSDASDNAVTWTSSDVTKATVANGKVTTIAAGIVTITAKAGDKTATSTVTILDGVKINGVIWATKNVAAPGAFATNPEDAGMFYQWNSKVGWPATGDIGGITATDGSTDWKNTWTGDYITPSSTDTWTSTNDPSPAGFRVPTYTEIQTLLNSEKVTSTWTTVNSVSGCKFTDITSGNSIFLPASGDRNLNGTNSNAGSWGLYWSSSTDNADYAYDLYIHSSGTNWDTNPRAFGFTVRPVTE